MTHDAEAAPEVPEAATLVRGLKASIEHILGPSVHPDCAAVIEVTMRVVGKLIADRAAARQRVTEVQAERDQARDMARSLRDALLSGDISPLVGFNPAPGWLTDDGSGAVDAWLDALAAGPTRQGHDNDQPTGAPDA